LIHEEASVIVEQPQQLGSSHVVMGIESCRGTRI
jgi:hypothetical protein